MRKSLSKLIPLWIALLPAVFILASCGRSPNNYGGTTGKTPSDSRAVSTTTPGSATEPVTLQFYLPPAQAPKDMDSVLAEFEKQTRDTLNTKLVFNYLDWGDLGPKVTMMLAAGEQVDSVFAAQWTTPSIQQYVSTGFFKNLDPYFLNDRYPGLKQAFSKQLMDYNAWTDAQGENHYYSIPFIHTWAHADNIIYRQDLADKYGIGVIDSWDRMEAYWDEIVKNEQGMTPFAWTGSINNLADWYMQKWEVPFSQKHNFDLANGIVIKDDGTVYKSKTIVAGLDPEFASALPSPLNTRDWYAGYAKVREWYTKGYLNKDILSETDGRLPFNAGKAASACTSLDTYNADKTALESGVPGARLGYFIPIKAYREKVPGNVSTGFRAWNFACIPVSSKYADRTMNFFNWLFSSKKNHDLFELGIEGKHWEAVGDNQFRLPDGIDAAGNYNFGGFQLTWSTSMMRFSADVPEDILTVNKLASDPDFFYKDILAGFSFVTTDEIKAEQARINNLASLLLAPGCGVVADYRQAVADIQKQYEQAGKAKYDAEWVKQLTEFYRKNPYQR